MSRFTINFQHRTNSEVAQELVTCSSTVKAFYIARIPLSMSLKITSSPLFEVILIFTFMCRTSPEPIMAWFELVRKRVNQDLRELRAFYFGFVPPQAHCFSAVCSSSRDFIPLITTATLLALETDFRFGVNESKAVRRCPETVDASQIAPLNEQTRLRRKSTRASRQRP
jgi:hypothetical protein